MEIEQVDLFHLAKGSSSFIQYVIFRAVKSKQDVWVTKLLPVILRLEPLCIRVEHNVSRRIGI